MLDHAWRLEVLLFDGLLKQLFGFFDGFFLVDFLFDMLLLMVVLLHLLMVDELRVVLLLHLEGLLLRNELWRRQLLDGFGAEGGLWDRSRSRGELWHGNGCRCWGWSRSELGKWSRSGNGSWGRDKGMWDGCEI